MCKLLYLTGGNTKDKNTRQVTYDEAEKMLLDVENEKNMYNPVCSLIEYREQKMYRKIIYFTFQVVAFDVDTTKQIWYKKIKDNSYFIDKIVYNDYKNQGVYVEIHFRNSAFFSPNICMIRIRTQNEWKHFVGNIEDTFFYRIIKFGDIETVYEDLNTSFEPYMHNIEMCDERFNKK